MVTARDIDWMVLARTIEHFRYNGYDQIEVPWLVSEEACRMTCPSFVRLQESQPGLFLVGSAEQSFLELELQGKLAKGRYVALTPCFRDEPVLDVLHHRHFMKVELYENEDVTERTLHKMMNQCMRNFSMLIRQHPNAKLVSEEMADGSFDITLNGIEIGSYGIRSVGPYAWIYGTGIAEPRFSTSLY